MINSKAYPEKIASKVLIAFIMEFTMALKSLVDCKMGTVLHNSVLYHLSVSLIHMHRLQGQKESFSSYLRLQTDLLDTLGGEFHLTQTKLGLS